MKITDQCSENRMKCVSTVLRERVTQIQAVHSFCPLPRAHKGDINKDIMRWRPAKTQLRATTPKLARRCGSGLWGSLTAPRDLFRPHLPWSFCLPGTRSLSSRVSFIVCTVCLTFLQPLHCYVCLSETERADFIVIISV